MLLQWVNFPYRIGGAGETWLPLHVIDVHTCDRSGRVSLTGCLQVLTFYVYESMAAMAAWPNVMVDWFKADVSQGLRIFLACLSEQVQSSTVLPLRAFHADNMCRHPGPPDAPVCPLDSIQFSQQTHTFLRKFVPPLIYIILWDNKYKL